MFDKVADIIVNYVEVKKRILSRSPDLWRIWDLVLLTL